MPVHLRIAFVVGMPRQPAYLGKGHTMRYVMRQKLWALGDDFTIKDETGADRFLVDGRAFSIGEKLSFLDPAGRELIFIKEKVLSWGPTYQLQRAGGAITTVKKDLWTFLNDRFTVDVASDGATPDDLQVQGDFWDHEYTFSRAGNAVAGVSKKWFSLADTYGVDVAPGEDDALILACTVVVGLTIEKAHRD